MKIIKPSVEYWEQGNDVNAHIAKCARICYASNKTDKNEQLVENLRKRNHVSMFRHESVYAIIPGDFTIYKILDRYLECPYINIIFRDSTIFISTNGNFMLDICNSNPYLYRSINDNKVSFNEFSSYECTKEIRRFTFAIITQISTSRELNRVSPNNIAEQSTRYVLEDGVICQPWWMNDKEVDAYNKSKTIILNSLFDRYINACEFSFNSYKILIKEKMLREDARGVLPLDTATKCVYTYTYNEWKDILDKRLRNMTGKAHNNAIIIGKLIQEEFNKLGYEI